MSYLRVVPATILLSTALFYSQSPLETTPAPVAREAPLTLAENLQGGSQLRLSDGSLYEVAPEDRQKTTFWLTPIPMTVGQGGSTQYPATLTNTLTGVTVKAKKVGTPSTGP